MIEMISTPTAGEKEIAADFLENNLKVGIKSLIFWPILGIYHKDTIISLRGSVVYYMEKNGNDRNFCYTPYNDRIFT